MGPRKSSVIFVLITENGWRSISCLKTESKKVSDLIFTNDSNKATQQFQNTAIERYFSSYSFVDNSGFNNNLNGGSGVKISSFDNNEFITETIKEIPSSELTPYKNKLEEFFQRYSDSWEIETYYIVTPYIYLL